MNERRKLSKAQRLLIALREVEALQDWQIEKEIRLKVAKSMENQLRNMGWIRVWNFGFIHEKSLKKLRKLSA